MPDLRLHDRLIVFGAHHSDFVDRHVIVTLGKGLVCLLLHRVLIQRIMLVEVVHLLE